MIINPLSWWKSGDVHEPQVSSDHVVVNKRDCMYTIFVTFPRGTRAARVRCVRTAWPQSLTSLEQVVIILQQGWRGQRTRNKLFQQVWFAVIVPCFAHQYSKRYVMDIIVYWKVNWMPPYTYIHTLTLNLTLTPNLTLTYIGARNMER
jgi:hypothetical protein